MSSLFDDLKEMNFVQSGEEMEARVDDIAYES